MMKKLFVLFTLLVLASGLLSSCSPAQKTFTMGFLPSESAAELSPKAEALAAFLEAEMGMPVEVVIPTSYESLIEGLRFGHLDATYMDAGPAWLAHKEAGAEVVLAEVKRGNTFYYAELYVLADSPLQTTEEVVGESIAFTSWTGSSGFVMPIGTMIQRELVVPQGDDFIALEAALQETFSTYVVSGGYTQSLDLLLNGDVTVAGGPHDAAERFLDEEDRDKIRSLETLGQVPSHPVVVNKELDAETKDAFVAAMQKLNEPEHNHILVDLYGVDAMQVTNTEEHLGTFGPTFEAVTGIHEQAYAKVR